MANLAVVTGGNRGIGLAVVEELARRGMRLIATSRDLAAGQAAVAPLRAAGLLVEARQLDVADPGSILGFAGGIAEPLAVLVNNAGVAPKGHGAEVAQSTLDTNYRGALLLTDALLPRLAKPSHVVMVSSGMGELSSFSPELRRRFTSAGRAEIDALLREFVDAVGRGDHEARGWPRNPYRVSKAAMNALVRSWGPVLRERGVVMNAVCPGWVRSDMGGAGAPRSLEEGAAGIVWAATLPVDEPSGGFFRDGKSIPW